MFKGIIFFLLTLMIILFPIPLKITLKYRNKVLEIFLYNKKINQKPSAKNMKRKHLKKIFFVSFSLNDMPLIIQKITNSKFKPILILNTKLEYGFDDAAFVAILFGVIHTIYSYIYLFLQSFTNVKSIDLKVIPHFKKNDINIEISSIIYTNLGKIIYISFIMISCLIHIKHKKTNS